MNGIRYAKRLHRGPTKYVFYNSPILKVCDKYAEEIILELSKPLLPRLGEPFSPYYPIEGEAPLTDKRGRIIDDLPEAVKKKQEKKMEQEKFAMLKKFYMGKGVRESVADELAMSNRYCGKELKWWHL